MTRTCYYGFCHPPCKAGCDFCNFSGMRDAFRTTSPTSVYQRPEPAFQRTLLSKVVLFRSIGEGGFYLKSHTEDVRYNYFGLNLFV